MQKAFKVAVILTAYDKMSRDIKDAVGKSTAELKRMQEASSALFGKGMAQIAGGTALAASLAPAVQAYAELEDSTTRLKTSMMGVGGVVAPEFEAVNKLAINLGNKLPGTTADFQNMFEVMLNQGIPAQTILDGVGQSAAYLAVALKLPYDEAAKLAAKLKEATGTSNQDMMAFMDTIAKTKNLGVETGEMQYAFGRSAGALKLMGIQGLDASKNMAVLYAQLIRTGMSGETVGTGFSSILNNMLDPKKMNKVKDATEALGVSLEFMKDGKFVGVENMVKQLDKLRQFSAEERASVVNALTGGGQDAAMLQTLISNGIAGYDEIRSKMEAQANLNDKVNAQLGTLSSIWEATTGTVTNALAAIGESIGPELKMFADLMGQGAAAMQAFATEYPGVFKIISLIIASASGIMIFAGVINMAQAAMIAFNLAVLANPIGLLIAAIAAAVIAVGILYMKWDEFTAWFQEQSLLMKIVVGTLLSPFIMLAGVFKVAMAAFQGEWGLAWQHLIEMFNTSILGMFFNAGTNIVQSIADGIMSGIGKVTDAISQVTQKAREYLPFSPAKEGAFKDLHKVKIVETIAQAVNPAPLVNAMKATTLAAAMAAPAAGPALASGAAPGMGAGGGAGVTISYSPQITLGAGANPQQAESFRALLQQHSRDLVQIISDTQARDSRKTF